MTVAEVTPVPADEPDPNDLVLERRVVAVRPLDGGRYAVTLGPGPDLYHFEAAQAPKLGSELRVKGTALTKKSLVFGKTEGSVTRLETESVEPLSEGKLPHRVVGGAWVRRVAGAVTRPLYSYQALGAAWIAERLALGKGSVLADAPGLGKSVQAIAAIVAANKLPALIVCPTILKQNWRTEIAYAQMPLEVQILSGGKGHIYPAHVYIVNYDVLKARERQLMQIGVKCIVFDEGHILKEARVHYGHRAAVANRLAKWVGLSIVLTGTPILNRPAEFWKLFHIADPKSWPDYDTFLDRYCKALTDDERAREPNVKRVETKWGSAKRVDELRSRAEAVMLRRTKAEAMPELPPKTRRSVVVSVSPEDWATYERCKADFQRWCESQGESIRVSRQRQYEALMKMTQLRQIAAMGKAKKAAREYLDGWFGQTRRPLVVFCYHRAVAAKLDEIARELGVQAVRIRTDGVSENERATTIRSFQEGDADMIIVPIRAAGLGLNLQRASDALFLERTWVPADLIQAEDRIHRIGQKDPVMITYLDAAKTVDEHMARVLDGKHTLMRRLVDGSADDGQDSTMNHVLSFIEELR